MIMTLCETLRRGSRHGVDEDLDLDVLAARIRVHCIGSLPIFSVPLPMANENPVDQDFGDIRD